MRQRERAGSGVKNVSQQVGCNVQIWSDCLRRTRDQKQMRWTCPFSPFVRAASSGEPPLSPTFNMSDRDKIYLSWASFCSRIRGLQSQSIPYPIWIFKRSALTPGHLVDPQQCWHGGDVWVVKNHWTTTKAAAMVRSSAGCFESFGWCFIPGFRGSAGLIRKMNRVALPSKLSPHRNCCCMPLKRCQRDRTHQILAHVTMWL